MKRLVMVLVMLVILMGVVFTLPACAETVFQDGLVVMLTTDKESYSDLEVINAKLTIRNTNNYPIQNVRTEITVPEGYKLLDGGEMKIGTLAAGAEQVLQTNMRNLEADIPDLPKTGDNSHGGLWLLLLILSVAALGVVSVKHKHANRIISLLLCVAVVSPYVLCAIPASAEIIEKSLSASKQVEVAGRPIVVTGIIRYNRENRINPENSVNWVMPIDNATMGYNTSVGKGWGALESGSEDRWHVALDMGPGGSDVKAVGDGVVVYSADHTSSNGNRIVIKHEVKDPQTGEDITIYSFYAHLKSRCVEVKENEEDNRVFAGQKIGVAGDHLHLSFAKTYSSDYYGYAPKSSFGLTGTIADNLASGRIVGGSGVKNTAADKEKGRYTIVGENSAVYKEQVFLNPWLFLDGSNYGVSTKAEYQFDPNVTPQLGNPTVTGFTLNGKTSEIEVKVGDTLSFAGTVSAPNGANLNAVQASVLLASNPKEGAMYKRIESIGVSTFELSKIPTITVGDSYNGFAMEAGKSYIVMLYAKDSNGNGFVDQNPNTAEYEGPSIVVHVKEETSTVENDFIYEIINDTVTITGYKGNATEVKIPEKIENLPVTRIGENAFWLRDDLTKIELPTTIEYIGDSAFAYCSNLSKIELPSGLTELGAGVFVSCKSVTEIVIHEGIKTIKASTFSGCTKLNRVILPKTLESIEGIVFDGCDSLKSIDLPDGLQFIDGGVFMSCNGLTHIEIPASVKQMGNQAFQSCENLKSVIIADGSALEKIENHTFAECSNLSSVWIPDGLQEIGEYAFMNCMNLSQIRIPDSVTNIGNGWYTTFYECDKEKLTIYGVSGSYAQKYADAAGIKFRPEDEMPDKPTAGCPTVTGYTLNGSANQIIVKMGQKLTFAGTVSAPAGLKAIQASILLESDPTKGCKAVRDDFAVGMSTFDLSEFAPIVVGQTYTDPEKNQSITMEAGKSYLINLYAADSNGNGFETTPSIRVIVEAEESAAMLSGTVVDENGVGFAGATVKLYEGLEPDQGKIVSTATTNAYGEWAVPGLKVGGTYSVGFSKSGYTFAPSFLSYVLVQGNNAIETVKALPAAVTYQNPTIEEVKAYVKSDLETRGRYSDNMFRLCMAVAQTESNFTQFINGEPYLSPLNTNGTYDIGIMQINSDNAGDCLEELKYDWKFNVRWGVGSIVAAYDIAKSNGEGNYATQMGITEEACIARGAYSRYNTGNSTSRWRTDSDIRDTNFWKNYSNQSWGGNTPSESQVGNPMFSDPLPDCITSGVPFTLKWTAVKGADKYRINYNTADGTINESVDVSGDETQYSLTISVSENTILRVNLYAIIDSPYSQSANPAYVEIDVKKGEVSTSDVVFDEYAIGEIGNINPHLEKYASGATFRWKADGAQCYNVTVLRLKTIPEGSDQAAVAYDAVTLQNSASSSYTIPKEWLVFGEYMKIAVQPIGSDGKLGNWKWIGIRFINDNTKAIGVLDYSPGEYFTDNDEQCTDHSISGIHSATNESACNCKCTYFDEAKNKTIDLGACQCFGYARYVQYKTYGVCSYASGSSSFRKTTSRTEKTVEALRAEVFEGGVGSHIRTSSGHSMIITAITDDGFSIIQANGRNNLEYPGGYRHCGIGTYTYTWDTYLSDKYGMNGTEYVEYYSNK